MTNKTILLIGVFVLMLLITFIATKRAMKNVQDVDPEDETFLK